ncbi:hypothetical protein D8674_004135 [Pyrus ussuriensis x Pyrus communis]|uniref:AB hydrolase-1 domain-containing protein n=1 Tax=Pyrus ussuriensis x Pyrus communis TaxID=2448454 RepID=A0A5N5FP75_9ROSA|nr:hypothetical protein D8674_004135 [Pyrus ussuriensis x Pyrus communis]
MGNIVAVGKFIMHGVSKLVGMISQTVEIEPGTKTKKSKPAVVFIHGFAMDGITTWQFQVLSLAKDYAVYVPDLLFFGGSTTDKPDRSPEFQAECVAKGLRMLGVERCTLVAFSYGGMVGFKMAELYPDLVESMVVTCSVMALTRSITNASLERLGFKCWSDYLLPDSVKGVRNIFEIATYKFPHLPDWIYKHYLEVMFERRKESEELLAALVPTRRQRNSKVNREDRPSCSHGRTICLQQGTQEISLFSVKRKCARSVSKLCKHLNSIV